MKTAHLVDPELRPLLDLMPARVLEASVLPAMREQRQAAALESLAQDDGLPVCVTHHHVEGSKGAPAVRVAVISPQHARKGADGHFAYSRRRLCAGQPGAVDAADPSDGGAA